MPGYVVNGTQQSTTMEDYAVRYSMYLNGFNGFMLNLIFHDSSIFSPTKKHSNLQNNIFSNIFRDFLQKSVIYSSNYISLWCTQVQTEDQTSGSPSTSQGSLKVDSRGQDPRSKIPRGRGPYLAYMRHRKVNDQTSRRNHRLEKKNQRGRNPMGRKWKKPTPGFNFYYAVFVKVNYRSYTWHGDVTWMKLGCMKLGWILK